MTTMQKEKTGASKWGLLLCFLALLLLDAGLRAAYSFGNTSLLWSWRPWAFSCCWCMLFTGIAILLPRIPRVIWMGLLEVLFGLMVLVHAGLYSASDVFFSFNLLEFAGDGAAFFSWKYIHIRKLLLLAVMGSFGLMAVGIILILKSMRARIGRKIVIGLLAVLLSGAGIIITHDSLSLPEDDLDVGHVYGGTTEEVYAEFSDKYASLMISGLYQYTFRDFCVTKGIGLPIKDKAELDEYYNIRRDEISGVNGMTGLFKEKNLIVIQMESLDTWMLKEEYMPNLFALQQRGWNFTNFYTPIFQADATFGTEVMVQTGSIGPTYGFNNIGYITHSFPLTVANRFKNIGYRVNVFHQNYGTVYNREKIYANWEMEKYHDWQSMGMTYDELKKDSAMIAGYDKMVDTNPFYSFIITISGHGPYLKDYWPEVSADHIEAANRAVEKTGIYSEDEDTQSQYVCAIAHAMEADAFIGGLMEHLEADGHINDTVLVIYGDHYGKYLTDREFLMQLKGVTDDNPNDLYNTPFMIYASWLEPMTVTKYASSIDVVPTLVNLFDLDPEREYYQYYVGDDMFGDKGGAVMFPDYSYVGDEQVASTWKKRIEISMETVINDYFRDWDIR